MNSHLFRNRPHLYLITLIILLTIADDKKILMRILMRIEVLITYLILIVIKLLYYLNKVFLLKVSIEIKKRHFKGMHNTFVTSNWNYKITLTFFTKNIKSRQKSHFLNIKYQLSWKSNVLEFFGLRHRF